RSSRPGVRLWQLSLHHPRTPQASRSRNQRRARRLGRKPAGVARNRPNRRPAPVEGNRTQSQGSRHHRPRPMDRLHPVVFSRRGPTVVTPRRAEWPSADFIIGNPPFLGNWRMRGELGDGYAETLRSVYKEVPEAADYVMYWWHRAAERVRAGQTRRFGFITTN